MPAAASAAFSFQPSSLEIARENFEKASAHLGLTPELQKRLSTPDCEIEIEIPVLREESALSIRQAQTSSLLRNMLRTFTGYRVQHNSVRGACLGSVELCGDFDRNTARGLAAMMTWKAALLDLPFGGACGGVACHPGCLSERELEEIYRGFAALTGNILGPYRDVLAPAPETPLPLRRALFTELSRKRGFLPATMTGKLPENGGIPSPASTVGRGLAALVQKVAPEMVGTSPLRVSIVGHNEVTAALVAALLQSGAQLASTTGRDDNHSSLALQIAADYALASDCDVLILCDRNIAIHPGNARKIRARLVFEAADLVISPSAEAILQNAGITVVPDMIANTGAAICAYVEWSLSLQQLPLSKLTPKLEEQVERGMLRAYRTAREYASSHSLPLRTAAYAVGIDRVACVEKLRVA